jgi:hypothetical protein
MCPVGSKPAILFLALASIGAPTVAQPDATEAALTDAGMHDVLEAHLLGLLQRVDDEQARAGVVERLAALYTRLLRDMPAGSDERAQVADRAWQLAEGAGDSVAVELRLTLLLDRYLPIERAAELDELGLLSDADRRARVGELRELSTRFRGMAQQAVADAALRDRRARAGGAEQDDAEIRTLSRERSLAAYYAAWSDLTLGAFEQRTISTDTLRWFGWLLGAEGDLPRLDRVHPASLEYDHVARAAIGVGRSHARNRDWLLAEQWLRLVTDSDRVKPAIRAQAGGRMLRLKADRGAWIEAQAIAETLRAAIDGEPHLPTPEARYLAISALTALRTGGDRNEVRLVAESALNDLIARGEIGHVLDLRSRFGASGLLGAGFIGLYATGLDRLEEAQNAGTPGMYLDAAHQLLRAGDEPDAARFPVQREDARLKAAFCEIRAGRPRQAEEIARRVLAAGPSEQAGEEARWLLIVAMDEAQDPRQRPALGESVRDYLTRYPGTERAGRLLVRHAGTELLEPGMAADGLRSIDEDDPLVLSARRVLARMVYKVWIDSRRRDPAARGELIGLIGWIWDREASAGDAGPARDRLDIARIALDAALGGTPVDLDRAEQAMGIAESIVVADPALARYGEELTLRSVEIQAARGRFEEAARLADGLRQAASPSAPQADRLLLSALLARLETEPDDATAAALGVRIGTRVAAELIPPVPERLTPDASRVVDRVWRLAAGEAERSDDAPMRALALRLARVVLERGTPSAQGLREMAGLAARAKDADAELRAWSVLLGAARDDEEAWWEARYHTLRLLVASDADAARRAYDQHKVMHPMPGLLPWTAMIDDLFPPAEDDAP